MKNTGTQRLGLGHRLWRWALSWVLVVAVVGLAGCDLGTPRPPQADTAVALAQQIAEAQVLLSSHLSGVPPAAGGETVKHVNVKRRQVIQGGERPIVAVEGTYTLGGKALSGRQQRQRRPFRLYLQQHPQGGWERVEPSAD